jgi:2-polyprenyl-6-methoxyphenol hydroxylase-like FAD-dependent oxidoreductase
VMHELGLLEEFLKLPHQRLTSATARFGDFDFHAAEFSHLPTLCKFVALMPQWDFLNFLSQRAKRFPGFQLRMQCEAVSLLRAGAAVVGVEARSPEGPLYIQTELVVGCDGRHATTRQSADMEVQEFGVPIDVLWFRLSRKTGDPEQLAGNINYGKALIVINRGDYSQAGLIIPKDSFEQTKQDGLEAFRAAIAQIAPYLSDRVHELQSWDQIKLLTVQINRLKKWHRPGLLCIGDAAHAMSPAGGVGINLAIQDAVATANLLAQPLSQGSVTEAQLASVQQRREFPTRVTQALQVSAHKGFAKVFETKGPVKAPWQLKLVAQIPGRPWVMGYVVGVGVRPEHVAEAETNVPCPAWSLKKAAVSAGAFLGAIVATAKALRI